MRNNDLFCHGMKPFEIEEQEKQKSYFLESIRRFVRKFFRR